MYDAIEDPYTCKYSTVLVNRLDLRDQAELDDFEAQISTARAAEPLPDGALDFDHYKAVIVIYFKTFTNGRDKLVLSESRREVIRFAFQRTLKDKRTSYSTICEPPATCRILTPKPSQAMPRISWAN
jgi:hypothetical protein